MTLDEKEIIFSHALKYNTISKQAQSFILNWFKARKIEPEIKQSPQYHTSVANKIYSAFPAKVSNI